MKWTIELPKTDQTRWVKKFALFPTRIKTGSDRIITHVWLQAYWQKQSTKGNYSWSSDGNFLTNPLTK